jgi:hypothetical protein
VPNPEPDPAQPFDEDAVLRDLEQLRGQILEARSRRERKAAEFDSFVKEARAVAHAERLAAVEQVEATTRVLSAARTADRASVAPLPLPPSLAASLPLPSPTPEITTPVSRRVMAPKRRRHLDRHPVVLTIKQHSRALIGVAASLLLVGVIYSLSGSDPASTPQSQPAQPTRQAATQASTPAAAAAAAQPPAQPDTRPIQIQLEAIRAVWMQVVVDGRREIGRTVPQGQRLSFGANNEINLRAGDAGAVRVYVAGVDRGVLGRDGQVVNRRFTK